MDSKSPPMSDGYDWTTDSMFTNMSGYDDSNMAFNDFTNLDAYDSPALSLRTPSRPNAAPVNPPPQSQHAHMPSATSTETSSQDSASDTSSQRKRKVTSVSPADNAALSMDGAMMDVVQPHAVQQFAHAPVLKQEDSMNPQFNFNSTASSPIQTRDFDSLSLNPQVSHVPSSMVRPGPTNNLQTINPGMFQIGPRDDSPTHNPIMYNNASPTAIFSTPSSDSNDTFNANHAWNTGLVQNPSWPGGFSNQYASPDGLSGLTPSPGANGQTPVVPTQTHTAGRSPLHIAPISTKSRVETQINIIMTLEQPPPGVEFLHLPLHTIAKSKLLAKEEYDSSKALELHTMLVCTSAMNTPRLKEKALQRAAAQSNEEVQRRAERLRETPDEEKNNMKDVDDADKPASGGEVRICNNCIQRERKRAGRKKLKKEEEQQHWERFETERVVVFNSNEYLPFKPHDPSQQPPRDPTAMMEENPYTPPDGALQASAAMRIACYCRHQSEKEGFRVIFTLKDQRGNVVAQQMSDSILITDDHKTHPQSFPTTMPGEVFYQSTAFAPNGLPTSFSMVDLSSQAHPFPSSRSAGNLQSMAYRQQYNPNSHIHAIPGYASQTTSATMTPTSLSRPGSPSSAGQSGPNKKRKSSSFHKRVPSGLTMTPRVDTSQAPSSSLSSAVSMNNPSFSPQSATGYQQGDGSYMTIPNAQYFNSGPPTPNESGPFFSQAQIDLARSQNAQAYFSHPSSAVPSRTNSPVLQSSRPNIAAYARQPIQTPTNSIQGRQQHLYGNRAAPGSSGSDHEQHHTPPTITKITPAEGPLSGGTEVSIYGYNFSNGTQVMFGDQLATTVFYGAQALLATSPPSRRPGPVNVALVPPEAGAHFPPPTPSRQTFMYTDTNPRMMEMALRFLSEQQTGSQVQWPQFTTQVANQYIQNNVSPAGIRGQGYDGGNTMAESVEDVVLGIFDQVDVSESPRAPQYDMQSSKGESMLSLACASGMHRVVAALLARGANPDTRDVGGYTPLMHATLHARTKTVQLLIMKGADPAIRSLKGYGVLDLAAPDLRDEIQHILQTTPRSRHSRPNLQSRVSFGACSARSVASWDISSASLYESETDGTSQQDGTSLTPSRRPSTQLGPLAEESVQPAECRLGTQCPTAMLAWRDALAAQIQHFQQTVSSFHLPPLPTLPGYQDSPMVRRLSSLVPGRCSSPLGNTTAPPAYSDLFPETLPADDKGHNTGAVDAMADEKCAVMFDHQQTEESRRRTVASACATKPSKTEVTPTHPLAAWCLSMSATRVADLIPFDTHSVAPTVDRLQRRFSDLRSSIAAC